MIDLDNAFLVLKVILETSEGSHHEEHSMCRLPLRVFNPALQELMSFKKTLVDKSGSEVGVISGFVCFLNGPMFGQMIGGVATEHGIAKFCAMALT